MVTITTSGSIPPAAPTHDPGQRRRRQCLVQRRRSFSTILNQPTAQFYHLATDNRDPYTIYGTQQDNTSIAVPSRVVHQTSPGRIASSPAPAKAATCRSILRMTISSTSARSVPRRAAATRCSATIAARDQIRLITTWPEVNTGTRRGCAKVPLRLDLSRSSSRRTIRTRSISAATSSSRPPMKAKPGTDQSRSHPRRSGNPESQRRPGQPGRGRRRNLRHRLLARRVAHEHRACSGPVRMMAWYT